MKLDLIAMAMNKLARFLYLNKCLFGFSKYFFFNPHRHFNCIMFLVQLDSDSERLTISTNVGDVNRFGSLS